MKIFLLKKIINSAIKPKFNKKTWSWVNAASSTSFSVVFKYEEVVLIMQYYPENIQARFWKKAEQSC